MYRQGDLLFIPVKKIKGRLQKDNIIALGELSGHSHVLKEGNVYKGNGEKYLEVPTPSEIVHEEHSPISLPAGNYLVKRQREYRPAEAKSKTVVD